MKLVKIIFFSVICLSSLNETFKGFIVTKFNGKTVTVGKKLPYK